MDLKTSARQIMRRAVALRLLGDACDGALDRNDALCQPPITLRARQALNPDAIGPVADKMECQQRGD